MLSVIEGKQLGAVIRAGAPSGFPSAVLSPVSPLLGQPCGGHLAQELCVESI